MAATVTSLDDYRVKKEVRENAVAEIENGYTQIPDDILDAIMLANLTKHQLNIVLAVWRKTYGYHKELDWISNTQFEKMTKIDSTKCSTAKNQLIKMKILVQEGRKVGINKKLSEWETDIYRNSKSFTKTVKKSFTETVKRVLPKQSNTKDNITKDIKYNNTPLTPHEVKGEGLARPEKRKPQTLNYNDYLVAYNEEVGDRLPHAVEANPKRKTRLKKIVGLLANPNLDGWRAYVRAFVGMAKPFYFGENNTGWTADIDYLLRETTLTGVREGKFADRGY
ncbi:replication protein [Arsenophonus apicola]|uniref:replication protein n=1 Tax=Arsenophonus apicola TaxID=2879119 RepID=UPI001CDC3CDA|nr:replication protein [Arsenophonus apicola]UBX30206.1 replication protein [Arsenophonus apicola]